MLFCLTSCTVCIVHAFLKATTLKLIFDSRLFANINKLDFYVLQFQFFPLWANMFPSLHAFVIHFTFDSKSLIIRLLSKRLGKMKIWSHIFTQINNFTKSKICLSLLVRKHSFTFQYLIDKLA